MVGLEIILGLKRGRNPTATGLMRGVLKKQRNIEQGQSFKMENVAPVPIKLHVPMDGSKIIHGS